jgi:heptosyltransferase-1
MSRPRFLVVRLGAMGDVIHALPAVATLKHSFPHSHVAWVIDEKWAPLLAGNRFVDEVIHFERRKLADVLRLWRSLRAGRYGTVIDFQGLMKSAVVAALARPERIHGFHQSQVRERLAALVYSHRTLARSAHVVERNLELAAAAGAVRAVHLFPLPPGEPEDRLPEGEFVLASPLAGWIAKQWPLERYGELARLLRTGLGLPLVLDGPPEQTPQFHSIPGVAVHRSRLAGLIHATRRAAAVVGIDSGPMHLAAVLRKPGVAIFGPTDPARNGPYGDSFTVLRSPGAQTSYKRRSRIEESMSRTTPEEVFEQLKARLAMPAARHGADA